MNEELPLYQSHKQVRAAKILRMQRVTADGGTNLTLELPNGDPHSETVVQVSAEYVEKHGPDTAGYYVEYEDGYESFCPAEPFEAGNKLVPTNLCATEVCIKSIEENALQRLSDLNKARDTQGTKGNFDYSEYMRGMYNGLELASAIMEGRDPGYKEADEDEPAGYQERVKEESAILAIKLGKLADFLTTATFHSLPGDDRGLLEQQLNTMTLYGDILGKRIARFQ